MSTDSPSIEPGRPVVLRRGTVLTMNDALSDGAIVESMSPINRPLVAASSLVGLWFLAMVLETLRVPVWALLLNGGLLLANVIVLIASIHQVTRERDRGHGDGGPPRQPPDTPDSGGGGGPSWWPEFERELAQYLAEHQEADRRRRRVPVGSADAA